MIGRVRDSRERRGRGSAAGEPVPPAGEVRGVGSQYDAYGAYENVADVVVHAGLPCLCDTAICAGW